MELTELIAQAPWREASTYRDTWPHEYVVIKKDGQEELLDAVCKRFCAGEGTNGRFFRMKNKYLFIGDYKYWLMTPCTEIDLKKDDYVLNRAPIYRDRRDFLIRDGDNGRRDKEIDGIYGISLSEYYTKGGGQMATEELGKLESVPVKDVWQDEARDFTPWLARNITQLGEALSMDLEVETQTDDFPLDILAKDTFSGVTVAIENQLASTNHWHLGHILNYAAGHDARVLVWVTPNIRREHRAALEWLNRWTPKEIEVYGVEVRAVRIGDSKPAPKFVPMVWTDALSTRAKAKSMGLTLAGFKNWGFFQPLVDKLREADFTDMHSAGALIYQRFTSGVLGMDYYASLESGRKAWVYIPGGPRDFKRPIFDKLRTDRDSIEKKLGMESDSNTHIEWNVTGSGSIGVWRDGSIDDPEEKLEEIRQWMFHYLLKFKEVFNPRMEAIIAEL